LVQCGYSLTIFIVMSVNPGSRITGMKSFSATQEQALRELISDALIDFGYGPRSTKNAPRPAERQPAPVVQLAPRRVWPENDEVLLTEERVCKGLGIGRTKLYQLIREKRLTPVRPGRKPMFKPEQVFAFIDSLEEEAA
jgi:excisionase family DNA binding protein